ncbi:MAG TPA: hypothetical protein VGQ39_02810 [Pyrinomonadaceae bacterium]|jgi:hypothetical protein|nr:hypothetical protein [Pyrinomonadaceae bacterium]
MANERVSVELTSSEALVLFEFLARFSNDDSLKIEDQAEERILGNLFASLESVLVEPLAGNYQDLLEKARCEVRDPVSSI